MRFPRTAWMLLMLAAPAAAEEWSPWRVLGPFEHTIGEPLENPLADQLADLGVDGEGPADRAYEGKLGVEFGWRALVGTAARSRASDVGHLDLNVAIPIPEELVGRAWNRDQVTFLHRTVTADETRAFELRVGTDDGVFVWWNGDLVHANDVPRALTMDSPIPVTLERGVNHLLVAVTQAGGGWALRVTTPVGFSDEAVDRAIDHGVRWLLDRQLVDGSFGHHESFGGGNAALGTYVLIKCGLAPDHPAVQRALAWARSRPTTYTYSVACEVLALCAQGDEADREWLSERVETLIDLQESSGLYNYPVYPDGTPRPDDLSTTVFAALALHAAEERNVSVPAGTWKDLIDGTLRCHWTAETVEGPDGEDREIAGFTYRPGAAPVTGSMTTAGISVLTLAEGALGRKLSRRDRAELEEARTQALGWLERHLAFERNPGSNGHHYWFVYGIERIGSLLDRDELGGVDWYEEGASFLLEQQEPNGSWPGATVDENTILALLFLRRATRPTSGRRALAKSWELVDPASPIRLRAQGDDPTTVFVAGFAPAAVEEHGWREPVGPELRVERIEYRARLEGDDAEPTVVARVDGDASEAAAGERFPARVEWPHNGTWLLSARAILAPRLGTADDPGAAVLESTELPIVVDGVVDPEVVGYALDEQRNGLRDREVETAASTFAGPGFEPYRAVDGTCTTRWLCATTDTEPSWSLRSSRSVPADELRLSHAYPRAADRAAVRVARVRVVVNGRDGRAGEHDLVLDPLRKTRIPLDGARVRSLEIRILELTEGALGTAAVGFSEIELVR